MNCSSARRRTWVRIKLGFQFASDARHASQQPRYQATSAWPPKLYVVSLLTAKERRQSIQAQLEEQEIDFKWWNAVDGTKPLPDDEVKWYLSGTRLKAYLRGRPGSRAYLEAACDLSHLRLMHDMVSKGRDLQIVLEDDAQLLDADFLGRLNSTMAALPADWDILWLNHGQPIEERPSHLLGWVGRGVRLFSDNSGTIGMVYRRSLALKVRGTSLRVRAVEAWRFEQTLQCCFFYLRLKMFASFSAFIGAK